MLVIKLDSVNSDSHYSINIIINLTVNYNQCVNY